MPPLKVAPIGLKMEKQPFLIKKPCSNCPFRNDHKAIKLDEGRREHIIESLLLGAEQSFPCHKTVYHKNTEKLNSLCPGAAAVARKAGRDTVLIQVATRLGLIPTTFLDDSAPLTIDSKDLNIDLKRVHL